MEKKAETNGNGNKAADRPRSFTHEGVRIKPLRNRGGSYSYRVDIGHRITGHKRMFRAFKTRAEAEAFASVMARERENNGVAAFTLTLDQRAMAKRALDLLCKSRLPDQTLVDAVEFYLRHHKPEGGDITVDLLMDRYLRGKKSGEAAKKGVPLRERSLTDLDNRLNAFARDYGTKLVKDVTSDEIRAWLDDPTKSRQTRRNYYTILDGMFRYAVKHKYAGSSPLAAIEKPSKAGDDEKEIGILKITEAVALLEAARAHPELELGWFVTLGLFCGARTAELERLAVDDVKLDQGFLHIGPTVAKKRRLRNVDFTVAISEDITTTGPDGKPHIERRAVTLDPVSTWLAVCPPPRNGHICPDAFRYRWMRLLETCGWAKRDPKTKKWEFLKPWPANAMRHSYASMLFEATSNAPLVSARLGHTDGVDLLFEHYRAMVKKDDGRRYFSFKPPSEVSNIVPIQQPAHPAVAVTATEGLPAAAATRR